MQNLISAIHAVRDLLSKGAFSSEDQVSKGVVMRLLQQLGWDVFNPDQVSSEFKIATKKVDYALRHEPFGPVVLIEVKDVGNATPKGEDQLFDYCSKQGVPLAVLTDGKLWNFYLPAGMGNYEQRRFAVVDLVDEDVQDCTEALTRYLGFRNVTSGQSRRHAQADYDAHRQRIVVRDQFEPVFRSLVSQPDPRIVTLFADEVEGACGFRPDDDELVEFLRQTASFTFSDQSSKRSRRRPRDRKAYANGGRKSRSDTRSDAPSFTLFGVTTSCKNDKGVLVGGLRALGERDHDFYGRLAPRLVGKRRRFLSRDRDQIYPDGSAESVLRSVEELSGGWWIGTHSSTRMKNEQLEKAREIGRLTASQFKWQMKGKTKG